MKRLLMVGDVHADLAWWLNNVVLAIEKFEIDAVVQLGDFGYWPRISEGQEFLAGVEVSLNWISDKVGKNVITYWIDGNHEDHLALSKVDCGDGGFGEISPHVFWIPRGRRWTWEGIRFLALGGAYSIDRYHRNLNSARYGWFLEEVLTEAQVELAKQGGACDVLLAHDAPTASINLMLPWEGAGSRYPEGALNSQMIQEVANVVSPKLLLHGHWHKFIDEEVDFRIPFDKNPGPHGRVVGLACNNMDKALAILELPDMNVYPVLPKL